MKKFTLSVLVLLAAVSVGRAQDRTPANVFFDKGKLTFESDDRAFRLWLDNRVYIDAAGYIPTEDVSELLSKPNKDLEYDDGTFRFSNGIAVRRARFAVKATLYEKWFGELDLDFAYNEVEMKDMFIGYRFSDRVSLKAGNFKEPMSMERLTSSKYLINMERPMAVEAFAGGRRLGVAATAWGNHWWVSGGVFGREVSILQKEKNRGDDGYGFTARAAWSPLNSEDLTLHIGGYGTYRKPEMSGDGDRFVEFRTFPESRVDRRRFVRAEIFNVNNYYTVGLEAAVKWGDLLVYGEYIFTELSRFGKSGDQIIGLRNATFNGWYATASYMLVGDQRTYSPEDAEFGPMNVRRRGGNLEIACRISNINMNDFHDARAVITGGSATSYSASLNWYPNRNVLIGLNYVFMDNDKYADDKGHVTVGGKALSESLPGGLDFHIIQLRLLLSF